MTPEEAKAKELVERFLNEPIQFPYLDTQDGQCIGSGYMTFKSAKQCALIAVDEIFNFMKMDDDFNKDCHMANTHWPRFWQSVKKYIENL